MKTNPLKRLEALGQSIWLDYIRRDLIAGGALERLIAEDGLNGMTSNPSIFEKAIAESLDYDDDIRRMAREGKSAKEIYDALSVRDVQSAADVFRPVFDRAGGDDGYVSLEVNPHLVRDTTGTIEEARRLWKALDRPNVFIKVPATDAGLLAIRRLTAEGINVNVTLLFGLPRYRQVADAYVQGVEDRLAQGEPVRHVASVASFFLSRIDVLADPVFESMMKKEDLPAKEAGRLRGRLAVACAKIAYQNHKEIFGSGRFGKLAARGARGQRLLWASTGTKNPAYSDVKYVDEIVAPGTVNTVPLKTLDAYRDHGDPKIRIEDGVAEARSVLERLPGLGLDIDRWTQRLEDEAAEKFMKPFDKLMDVLSRKSAEATAQVNR